MKKSEKDNYIYVADSPDWLKTDSPFDQLDDDWHKIIVFFVLHVPAEGVSFRSKSLASYGWGSKSGQDDFKRLKARLIKYSGMSVEDFVCVNSYKKLKVKLQHMDLEEFNPQIERQIIIIRKDKSGENESLFSHIRNAFAHGHVSFINIKDDVAVILEDINNEKAVSARMIIYKSSLLNWIKVIEAGPFISNDDLDKEFYDTGING